MCWLAGFWMLVSRSYLFQITLILETDIVTSGAQNQSFGMLCASTLAPWGTMGAIQGDLGIHERTPWGPCLDFYRFLVDLGDPILTVSRAPWTKINVFVHACFQVTLVNGLGV